MRLTMGVLIISMFFSLVAKSTRAEDDKTRQRSKQRYLVFCRWFDENGRYCTPGIRSLANGERASIHPSSPIIDVKATAGSQPDGATLDIDVGKADAHEKYVVRFVKFNETLVIPLGENCANGTKPRVEILIGAGDIIRMDWKWDLAAAHLRPADAEREAAFRAIFSKETGRVSCERRSRLEALIGSRSYLDVQLGIEHVRSWAALAYLYSFLPHRSGPLDVLGGLYPELDDCMRVAEEALFGSVSQYTVELWNSPTLEKSLERLARLSDASGIAVVIHAKEKPVSRIAWGSLSGFQHAVWDTGPEAWGEADGKPVLWSEDECHTAETMKTHTERVKTVSVDWQMAESAIPAFREFPNLEQVLLNVAQKSDESKAQRTLEAMKKALPNAEVHLVLCFADDRSGNTPPRTVDQGRGEVNMGIVTARIIIETEEEERLGVCPVE